MNWPDRSEFRRAVAKPTTSFKDHILCRSDVVRLPPAKNSNKKGVPEVISGEFADVYRFDGPGGAFAVRCFTRPDTQAREQKRRYGLISQYIDSFSSPYLVKFQFIEQGILVSGEWYPVVRMRWVEGVPLNKFAESCLGCPDMLLDLAKQLRGLVVQLQGFGMAHCDLQHGNILVTPQHQLKLVDYDDMFVPALRDSPPAGGGQKNFTHPRRQPKHYGKWLDNFPALVILLSLRALAYDRTLWDRYSDSDNLLFKKQDFEKPDQSDIFKELRNSPDSVVRQLANTLAQFCADDPANSKSLEYVLSGIPLDELFPANPQSLRRGISTPSRPTSSPGLAQQQAATVQAAAVTTPAGGVNSSRSSTSVKPLPPTPQQQPILTSAVAFAAPAGVANQPQGFLPYQVAPDPLLLRVWRLVVWRLLGWVQSQLLPPAADKIWQGVVPPAVLWCERRLITPLAGAVEWLWRPFGAVGRWLNQVANRFWGRHPQWQRWKYATYAVSLVALACGAYLVFHPHPPPAPLNPYRERTPRELNIGGSEKDRLKEMSYEVESWSKEAPERVNLNERMGLTKLEEQYQELGRFITKGRDLDRIFRTPDSSPGRRLQNELDRLSREQARLRTALNCLNSFNDAISKAQDAIDNNKPDRANASLLPDAETAGNSLKKEAPGTRADVDAALAKLRASLAGKLAEREKKVEAWRQAAQKLADDPTKQEFAQIGQFLATACTNTHALVIEGTELETTLGQVTQGTNAARLLAVVLSNLPALKEREAQLQVLADRLKNCNDAFGTVQTDINQDKLDRAKTNSLPAAQRAGNALKQAATGTSSGVNTELARLGDTLERKLVNRDLDFKKQVDDWRQTVEQRDDPQTVDLGQLDRFLKVAKAKNEGCLKKGTSLEILLVGAAVSTNAPKLLTDVRSNLAELGKRQAELEQIHANHSDFKQRQAEVQTNVAVGDLDVVDDLVTNAMKAGKSLAAVAAGTKPEGDRALAALENSVKGAKAERDKEMSLVLRLKAQFNEVFRQPPQSWEAMVGLEKDIQVALDGLAKCQKRWARPLEDELTRLQSDRLQKQIKFAWDSIVLPGAESQFQALQGEGEVLPIQDKGKGKGKFYAREILHVKTGIRLKLVPPELDWTSLAGADGAEHLRKFVGLKPYYLGVWEVSNEQFGEVPKNQEPNAPVVSVSYATIQDWLGGRGTGLRLPTAVEWQFAARAGRRQAEVFESLGSGRSLGVVGRPDARLNAFGLYDLGGNAAEWAFDKDRQTLSIRDRSSRTGGMFNLEDGRPSEAANRETSLGFRVAASLPQ